MFETLVNDLLTSLLGNYIKQSCFSKDKVNIAVWSGYVVLRELELREDIGISYDGIHILKGVIGSIEIKIPWNRLHSDSIVITVDDVYLFSSVSSPDIMKQYLLNENEKKQKLIELLYERAKRDKYNNTEKEEIDSSFMTRLRNKIINNIEIHVRNLHFRLDNYISGDHPFSIGITMESMHIQSANENWQPEYINMANSEVRSIYKMIQMNHLSLYLNPHCNLGGFNVNDIKNLSIIEFINFFRTMIPTRYAQNILDPKTNHHFILAPVDASARLKISKDQLDSSLPTYEFNIILDDVKFCLEESQYCDFLYLASAFSTFSLHKRYYKYRKMRPKFNIIRGNGSALKWFQYAAKCVVDDVKNKRMRYSWAYLKERKDDRQLYIRLWKRKSAMDYGLADTVLNGDISNLNNGGCDGNGSVALAENVLYLVLSQDEERKMEEIEMRRTVEDILLFRYLADMDFSKEFQRNSKLESSDLETDIDSTLNDETIVNVTERDNVSDHRSDITVSNLSMKSSDSSTWGINWLKSWVLRDSRHITRNVPKLNLAGRWLPEVEIKELFEMVGYDYTAKRHKTYKNLEDPSTYQQSTEKVQDNLLPIISVTLRQGSIQLASDPDSDIIRHSPFFGERYSPSVFLAIEFSRLQIGLSLRNNSYKFELSLESFEVHEKSGQSTNFPKLVYPKARTAFTTDRSNLVGYNKFFLLSYDTNPPYELADVALKLHMEPINIFYLPMSPCWSRLTSFLKGPDSLGLWDALDVATLNKFSSLKAKTEAKLEYAKANRTSVDLDIKIKAPLIVLPESNNDISCPFLLFDLGEILFTTKRLSKFSNFNNSESSNTIGSVRKRTTLNQLGQNGEPRFDNNSNLFFKQLGEEEDGDDDSVRLQHGYKDGFFWREKFYDSYELSLNSIQAILATKEVLDLSVGYECPNYPKEAQLVEKCNIGIVIRTSILPQDPTLTRCYIQGNLPSLHLNLSIQKLKNLLRLFSGYSKPYSAKDENLVFDKRNFYSTANSKCSSSYFTSFGQNILQVKRQKTDATKIKVDKASFSPHVKNLRKSQDVDSDDSWYSFDCDEKLDSSEENVPDEHEHTLGASVSSSRRPKSPSSSYRKKKRDLTNFRILSCTFIVTLVKLHIEKSDHHTHYKKGIMSETRNKDIRILCLLLSGLQFHLKTRSFDKNVSLALNFLVLLELSNVSSFSKDHILFSCDSITVPYSLRCPPEKSIECIDYGNEKSIKENLRYKNKNVSHDKRTPKILRRSVVSNRSYRFHDKNSASYAFSQRNMSSRISENNFLDIKYKIESKSSGLLDTAHIGIEMNCLHVRIDQQRLVYLIDEFLFSAQDVVDYLEKSNASNSGINNSSPQSSKNLSTEEVSSSIFHEFKMTSLTPSVKTDIENARNAIFETRLCGSEISNEVFPTKTKPPFIVESGRNVKIKSEKTLQNSQTFVRIKVQSVSICWVHLENNFASIALLNTSIDACYDQNYEITDFLGYLGDFQVYNLLADDKENATHSASSSLRSLRSSFHVNRRIFSSPVARPKNHGTEVLYNTEPFQKIFGLIDGVTEKILELRITNNTYSLNPKINISISITSANFLINSIFLMDTISYALEGTIYQFILAKSQKNKRTTHKISHIQKYNLSFPCDFSITVANPTIVLPKDANDRGTDILAGILLNIDILSIKVRLTTTDQNDINENVTNNKISSNLLSASIKNLRIHSIHDKFQIVDNVILETTVEWPNIKQTIKHQSYDKSPDIKVPQQQPILNTFELSCFISKIFIHFAEAHVSLATAVYYDIIKPFEHLRKEEKVKNGCISNPNTNPLKVFCEVFQMDTKLKLSVEKLSIEMLTGAEPTNCGNIFFVSDEKIVSQPNIQSFADDFAGPLASVATFEITELTSILTFSKNLKMKHNASTNDRINVDISFSNIILNGECTGESDDSYTIIKSNMAVQNNNEIKGTDNVDFDLHFQTCQMSSSRNKNVVLDLIIQIILQNESMSNNLNNHSPLNYSIIILECTNITLFIRPNLLLDIQKCALNNVYSMLKTSLNIQKRPMYSSRVFAHFRNNSSDFTIPKSPHFSVRTTSISEDGKDELGSNYSRNSSFDTAYTFNHICSNSKVYSEFGNMHLLQVNTNTNESVGLPKKLCSPKIKNELAVESDAALLTPSSFRTGISSAFTMSRKYAGDHMNANKVIDTNSENTASKRKQLSLEKFCWEVHFRIKGAKIFILPNLVSSSKSSKVDSNSDDKAGICLDLKLCQSKLYEYEIDNSVSDNYNMKYEMSSKQNLFYHLSDNKSTVTNRNLLEPVDVSFCFISNNSDARTINVSPIILKITPWDIEFFKRIGTYYLRWYELSKLLIQDNSHHKEREDFFIDKPPFQVGLVDISSSQEKNNNFIETISVNLNMKSIDFYLINCVFFQEIQLFHLHQSIEFIKCDINRDCCRKSLSMLKMKIDFINEAHYQNMNLFTMEPLLEKWKCSIDILLNYIDWTTLIHTKSSDICNINLSYALIGCLDSLKDTWELVQNQRSNSISSFYHSYSNIRSNYWIKNQTGSEIRFWSNQPKRNIQTAQCGTIEPVELEKLIFLNGSVDEKITEKLGIYVEIQQADHSTYKNKVNKWYSRHAITFDGSGTRLYKLYSNKHNNNTGRYDCDMLVTLLVEDGHKILLFESLVWLENNTTSVLEVAICLPPAKGFGSTRPRTIWQTKLLNNKDSKDSKKIPIPLFLTADSRSRLTVRPPQLKNSEEDICSYSREEYPFHLSTQSNASDMNGSCYLISFKSLLRTKPLPPFNLLLKETYDNSYNGDEIFSLVNKNKKIISFHPPLIIENLTGAELEWIIQTEGSLLQVSGERSQTQCEKGSLSCGKRAAWCLTDCSIPIFIKIRLQNFTWSQNVDIHQCANCNNTANGLYTEKFEVSDRCGNSLFVQADIYFDLKNKNDDHKIIFKIVFFVPYWIINYSGLPLEFRYDPDALGNEYEAKTILAGQNVTSEKEDYSLQIIRKRNEHAQRTPNDYLMFDVANSVVPIHAFPYHRMHYERVQTSTMKNKDKMANDPQNNFQKIIPPMPSIKGLQELNPNHDLEHKKGNKYGDDPLEDPIALASYGNHDLKSTKIQLRVLKRNEKNSFDYINTSIWSSSFNLELVGARAFMEINENNSGLANKVYNFGVSIHEALEKYYRTKIITITPRYFIMNGLVAAIEVRQVFSNKNMTDTSSILNVVIDSGSCDAFHWTNIKKKRLIQFRYAGDDWLWSGGISIDEVGETTMRLTKKNKISDKLLVRVITKTKKSVITVYIKEIKTDSFSTFSPYKIQNFTLETLRINQKNVANASDILLPHHTINYCWDEPTFEKLILVYLLPTGPNNNSRPVKIGTFRLDEVRKYQDNNNKNIQVDVLADGPTRILRFTDVRLMDKSIRNIGFVYNEGNEYYQRLLNDENMNKVKFNDVETEMMDLKKLTDGILSLEVNINLEAIGISLIDSFPQELLYACATGINIKYDKFVSCNKITSDIEWNIKEKHSSFEYDTSGSDVKMNGNHSVGFQKRHDEINTNKQAVCLILHFHDIQIDNQLNTLSPILLHFSSKKTNTIKAKHKQIYQIGKLNTPSANKEPVLSLKLIIQNEFIGINFIRKFRINAKPITVNIDSILASYLIHFVKLISLSSSRRSKPLPDSLINNYKRYNKNEEADEHTLLKENIIIGIRLLEPIIFFNFFKKKKKKLMNELSFIKLSNHFHENERNLKTINSLSDTFNNIIKHQTSPNQLKIFGQMINFKEEKKLYIEQLQVCPIYLTISYNSGNPFHLYDVNVLTKQSKLKKNDNIIKRKDLPPLQNIFSAFGTSLKKVENASVQFHPLIFTHSFATMETLTSKIWLHYQTEAFKQAYLILGSVDILGNPIRILKSLSAGIKDFIYEPYHGFYKGPIGFGTGLFRGFKSILQNSFIGLVDFTTLVSTSIALGLIDATITLDFYTRYSRFQSPFQGIAQSLSGLVVSPINGLALNGLKGFIGGALAGLFGFIIKPLAVTMFYISNHSNRLRKSLHFHHYYNKYSILSRIRPPRYFSSSNRILIRYSYKESLNADLMKRIYNGKYQNDEPIGSIELNENTILLISKRRIFYIEIIDNFHIQTIWKILSSDLVKIEFNDNNIIHLHAFPAFQTFRKRYHLGKGLITTGIQLLHYKIIIPNLNDTIKSQLQLFLHSQVKPLQTKIDLYTSCNSYSLNK